MVELLDLLDGFGVFFDRLKRMHRHASRQFQFAGCAKNAPKRTDIIKHVTVLNLLHEIGQFAAALRVLAKEAVGIIEIPSGDIQETGATRNHAGNTLFSAAVNPAQDKGW